jgi:hypothetical protein
VPFASQTCAEGVALLVSKSAHTGVAWVQVCWHNVKLHRVVLLAVTRLGVPFASQTCAEGVALLVSESEHTGIAWVQVLRAVNIVQLRHKSSVQSDGSVAH